MSYVPYLAQGLIAYNNVFLDGTLSASSDPEGGEKENALDGFTYSRWRPLDNNSPNYHWLAVALDIATPCDYFAIHAQNLAAIGGTVELQGSANGAAWSTVSGPHTPDESGPWLWQFAQVSYQYWRLVMTGTGATLGVLQAGVVMDLPEGIYVGHKPATYNRANKIQNQKSEGGQLLGRSLIREGAQQMTISQERVDPAWARTTWNTFALYAETRPFFFVWRSMTYPREVIYAWAVDAAEVKQSSTRFMSVSLSIDGQIA